MYKQVLKRDEKSQANAPKIIQQEFLKSTPAGSRPFSTAARSRQQGSTRPASAEAEDLMHIRNSAEVGNPGHIFGLPELPLPSHDRLKQRYDPLILQVTNLLMRHGKKGVAQRVCPSVSLPRCCLRLGVWTQALNADIHDCRTWL
jgi:small subunit ribosomal protein S7